MGKKTYKTEEERIAVKREYNAKRYQEKRDKILAQQAERYKQNKDKILAQRAERYKQNKDKILAKQAEYRKNNKDKIREQKAEYHSTPKGRAISLLSDYRKKDRKFNRGDCTIDAQWIVDNIFTQSCHYCGETDWKKLGCDRKDSSLPHTPENVVCSCWDCNHKKNKTPYEEFMRMIGKIA